MRGAQAPRSAPRPGSAYRAQSSPGTWPFSARAESVVNRFSNGELACAGLSVYVGAYRIDVVVVVQVVGWENTRVSWLCGNTQ